MTLDVTAKYGRESRVSRTCEAKLITGYFYYAYEQFDDIHISGKGCGGI